VRQQSQVFQQMCDSVNVSARETHQNMNRIHQMLQDPAVTQDPDMQRDMDQLREHAETMTQGMEQMLDSLDQVQQRLETRLGGQ
jgi:hypothetical protein